MPRPMITMTRNRLVYHERQHLPRFLFIVWLITYIIMIAVMWFATMSAYGMGLGGVAQGRAIGGLSILLVLFALIPLVFFGGFAVNAGAKTAWRLRLPLLPVKRFSIDGVDGLGIRDRIKLYRAADGGIDKVHHYTLFFRYWDGGMHDLYDTQKQDRALQLQQELADYLFIQPLPVTQEDIPGRKAV